MALPQQVRYRRGGVESVNHWTEAQTHRRILSVGQNIILHFLFSLPALWLFFLCSVLLSCSPPLPASPSSSWLFFWLFPVVFLLLLPWCFHSTSSLMFSFYIFPDISLLLLPRCFPFYFCPDVFSPSTSLILLSSFLSLLRQKFLYKKKRLPNNYSYIFSKKKIKIFRQKEITLWSQIMFFLEAHK